MAQATRAPSRGGIKSLGKNWPLSVWQWIWVGVGAVVVLVVILYLIGIVASLTSINKNLKEANAAVTGAGGDVEPLPAHVAHVNETLGTIDTVLKPIPAQADTIIGSLGSIKGSLTSIDTTLKGTNGKLGTISGSLVDTSGVLGNISGTLGRIDGTLKGISGTADTISASLVDTDKVIVRIKGDVVDILGSVKSIRDEKGTAAILAQVGVINGTLTGVKGDTGNVLPALIDVNKHLVSICTSAAVTAARPAGSCG